ncbi:MAG: endonuclease/exonuclease/phosphatase family protein [Cytophagales bacterium]|nr:endonuclease/exonuclease/phosphatase family protein [Cytophagales bacterium]
MKLRITFFLLLISAHMACLAQISVMTYNIRYDTPNDGENWWENRKQDVTDLILRYRPDFMGIQEGLDHQVTYLDQILEEYAFVGIGRDGAGITSEYTAIFFDTTKYKLIESKTFWLSPTPDQVSRGWDAALNRITTYARFEARASAEQFHVFNAHFDHIGVEARERSAQLILEQISQWNLLDEQLIVMGDFNSTPESKPIKTFNESLVDTRLVSGNRSFGPEGTFNAFDKDAELTDRIDFVFVKNIKVLRQRHIDDLRPNMLWPSDHLPVFSELEKLKSRP